MYAHAIMQFITSVSLPRLQSSIAMGWRHLLLLLLLEYLMVVADSCPMVDMLNPSSGSTDPSFTYTIAGVDFGSNILLTSTAGPLDYTVQSDSL